jgi:hypothetical protein
MPEGLGKRPLFELDRRVAETNWLMAIRLEIEIQGEILQVRDENSSRAWSQIYPGRVFRTQDVSFTYDELRGMGNGTHLVRAKKPPGKPAGGSKNGD